MSLFALEPSDVADTNDDWYTPHWIFEAAGLTFDMDVCAPIDPSRRTCPARQFLTPIEDGLAVPWSGLVWCNPPYSGARPWVEKFLQHGNGLVLVPVVRSGWLEDLWSTADAVTLLGVEFLRSTGRETTFRWMSLLAGIGNESERIGRIGPMYRPYRATIDNKTLCQAEGTKDA